MTEKMTVFFGLVYLKNRKQEYKRVFMFFPFFNNVTLGSAPNETKRDLPTLCPSNISSESFIPLPKPLTNNESDYEKQENNTEEEDNNTEEGENEDYEEEDEDYEEDYEEENEDDEEEEDYEEGEIKDNNCEKSTSEESEYEEKSVKEITNTEEKNETESETETRNNKSGILIKYPSSSSSSSASSVSSALSASPASSASPSSSPLETCELSEIEYNERTTSTTSCSSCLESKVSSSFAGAKESKTSQWDVLPLEQEENINHLKARFKRLFDRTFDLVQDTEGSASQKLQLLVRQLANHDKTIHWSLLFHILDIYGQCGANLGNRIMIFIKKVFDEWNLNTDTRLIGFFGTLERELSTRDLEWFVSRFNPEQAEDGILRNLFRVGAPESTGKKILDRLVRCRVNATQIRFRELQLLALELQNEYITDRNLYGTLNTSNFLASWTRYLYEEYLALNAQHHIIEGLGQIASSGIQSTSQDNDLAENIIYCKEYLEPRSYYL